MSVSPIPVLNFEVPPGGGEEVVKDADRPRELNAERTAVRAERRIAAEAGKQEVAAAKRRAAEARVNDTRPPEDPAKVLAEVEATDAALAARVREIEEAIDLVGNRLAGEIGADLDGWLLGLGPQIADTEQDAREHLAEAAKAIALLGDLYPAEDWLRNFSIADAIRGEQNQFVSEPTRIDASHFRGDSFTTPAQLFALLMQALEPPRDKPGVHTISRKLKVAESSLKASA
jgi:hypothetical protein